ncbi:MAG TPA: DUF3320 domain-containing protein [Candidatus Limnocylindria bacterium]|nr:DUF3320 domain-containing protein [Candidatus Limnocylindria bacterium]
MPSEPRQLLDRARRELLDLSTRNRLLSIPVASKSARVINIADELSAEVFRLLVSERKTVSFLPGRKSAATHTSHPPEAKAGDAGVPAPEAGEEPAGDEAGLPPPDETEDEATGLARRHVDSRLQTSLTPEGLQRRLLDLFHDAQTTIEETGVNVLYLALGQLKWFDEEDSGTPRYAPLVLVPVDLFRKSAADRFFLKAREEDVEENLSLRAKLQADFQLELPEFPDPETLNLSTYFAQVTGAIVGEAKWEVLPNAMSLGFFSFAKFLMYRDLDADTWPAGKSLLQNRFVTALLGEGFPTAEPPIPDHTALDELIPVERLDHVVDADGSQSLAIEMVRQGRSLVIQGPPGTGKSQSIANIIATAVLDGKKVLFVAEKLAALEVVKRRLEREGLGDMCLELHSNKASKRGVLAEIGRTWRLGKPREGALEGVIAELESRRTTLNGHCTGLHSVHAPTGLTPYRVLGELVRLGEPESGTAPTELPGAETWSAEARARREQVVADLAERIRQIGTPAQHPWRGVQRETVLKIDLPPLLAKMQEATPKFTAVQEDGRKLAQLLGVAAPPDLSTASWLSLLAEHVAKAPALDRQALCAGVWNAGLEGLSDLVAAGRRFAQATQRVGAQVTEAAWEKDFEKLRAVVAAHGRSMLRLFNGEYRSAMAELRGVLKGELPPEFAARLAFVDELVAGQKALRTVRTEEAQGISAFGSSWRKERSDWAQLEQVLTWVNAQRAVGLGEEFRRLFAGVQQPANVGALGVKLADEVREAQAALMQLAEELKLDPMAAFGAGSPDQIPLAELLDRLATWREQPEDLSRWNNYFMRAGQGREFGLGPLVEGLASGSIAPADARLAFQRACYGQILRQLCRLNPELARFDGELHSRQVDEFRHLDRERLTLAKYRVLAAHHAQMPGMNAGVGAVGIVNSELERKRGHRPVRQLLRDAGSVIQAVKPVFMMSPLSVAQFLAPGAVEFDLLVVDEASQVQPVDALGAVARCQQIVVVGDSKQLPPTRFFARVTSDEPAMADEDESGTAPVQEIESILGLCSARGLPQSMLRWHYRSRHHSLIAVSNHEFYEDRLFIVPSPYAASTEQGLQFRHVAGGVFDSGGSGNNRIEAKTVGRAVIEHARAHPGLSLGVAAFSVRQQQAILDELELLRRENPDTEAFFAGHPNEPFFVKNLENVQGDERDVIFISIGYGRDLNGQLAMRFGPLSNDGGERRLNVLISRAKKRCEVFSSILADDIDLARASGRGVKSLNAFLQFAQTGRLATAARDIQEDESPFEKAVSAALEAEGYEVHARVGVAGFFVDLAVVDRERAGRYVLGIECDGAAYRASRSARDRDRLRQAVLEDHGWILHRIWSTDWFQRPTEQLRRTVAAIERASLAVDEALQQETARREAAAEIVREQQEETEVSGPRAASEAYQVASFAPPPGQEPHELPPGEMAGLLSRIVEVEGPIHEDELVTRVKDLWGLQRAGTRLQDAVAKGIRSLLVSRRCAREDDCLVIVGQPVRPRNREAATPPGLKKPNLLPPSEIRAAILALLDEAHGATHRELPTAVARMLGFKTTTAILREAVERQVQKLEQQGEITEANGLLQRKTAPPAAKPPA